MKPLNRKAYTSIGHLPGSKLGSGDHRICDGQAKICLDPRMGDTLIVQEKVDGTCVAVYKKDDDNIVAINRAGWECANSPHEQHQHFNTWAQIHRDRFLYSLLPGEWLVGEWCMMAHGTRYNFGKYEPFFAFECMRDAGAALPTRELYRDFAYRMQGVFNLPPLLHYSAESNGIEPETAYSMTQTTLSGVRVDPAEGVIYRIESKNEFNFPAKWVREGYIPGKYFVPKGSEPLWNWRIEDLTTDVALLE